MEDRYVIYVHILWRTGAYTLEKLVHTYVYTHVWETGMYVHTQIRLGNRYIYVRTYTHVRTYVWETGTYVRIYTCTYVWETRTYVYTMYGRPVRIRTHIRRYGKQVGFQTVHPIIKEAIVWCQVKI